MTFKDILSEVIDWLRQDKRITYRALKRQFDLDDDYLDDLKDELIEAKQIAKDENGRVLVWIGEAGDIPPSTSQPDQPETQPVVEQAEPVQETPSSVEPHTSEAERRQLTVMFCDLVGATELSGRFDPEDYRELVREYQSTCGDVIEHFSCHIAQTLGDGLLVYSGYPIAHENDAERAVRVGLGILDAMTGLNERLEQDRGIQLSVRVGIHTGPVVVGEVGAGSRQEQLALGEAPNVAARIQGLAEPNTVVISADTYPLIQGYFDCVSLGKHELRGVVQPIVIYRVMQESGARSRLDIASTRGLTPLVGREQEVGLLFERWEQAQNGHGQVVLLSGEAGIGKSRLLQVLKDHVAEGTHTRLECRSSPYFTNSALYPITDCLQRMLRFQTDDTPEKRLEKLEENLSQYRIPLEETVPLFSVLLSLSVPEDRYPPLNLSPQRQRQKSLEAIVAIILELAEREPVLFILEDLHWTDPTTLEFIDLLIDQTPTASTYVLVTCRPEFQPDWSHRSYLSEVSLNRLTRTQIEQIALQVAGGKTLPSEVIEQLGEKTDGVQYCSALLLHAPNES
jgi:class 3 adenylate cyclase